MTVKDTCQSPGGCHLPGKPSALRKSILERNAVEEKTILDNQPPWDLNVNWPSSEYGALWADSLHPYVSDQIRNGIAEEYQMLAKLDCGSATGDKPDRAISTRLMDMYDQISYSNEAITHIDTSGPVYDFGVTRTKVAAIAPAPPDEPLADCVDKNAPSTGGWLQQLTGVPNFNTRAEIYHHVHEDVVLVQPLVLYVYDDVADFVRQSAEKGLNLIVTPDTWVMDMKNYDEYLSTRVQEGFFLYAAAVNARSTHPEAGIDALRAIAEMGVVTHDLLESYRQGIRRNGPKNITRFLPRLTLATWLDVISSYIAVLRLSGNFVWRPIYDLVYGHIKAALLHEDYGVVPQQIDKQPDSGAFVELMARWECMIGTNTGIAAPLEETSLPTKWQRGLRVGRSRWPTESLASRAIQGYCVLASTHPGDVCTAEMAQYKAFIDIRLRSHELRVERLGNGIASFNEHAADAESVLGTLKSDELGIRGCATCQYIITITRALQTLPEWRIIAWGSLKDEQHRTELANALLDLRWADGYADGWESMENANGRILSSTSTKQRGLQTAILEAGTYSRRKKDDPRYGSYVDVYGGNGATAHAIWVASIATSLKYWRSLPEGSPERRAVRYWTESMFFSTCTMISGDFLSEDSLITIKPLSQSEMSLE